MIGYLLGLALGASAPMTTAAAQAASVAARPPGAWVIVDVTVIPADTDEALAHRTVVVRDGKIERILPPGAKAKVKDATVVDGRGKYLVPGFVDDPRAGSGAVRVGERANLVLLEADPLADIQNISRLAGVFAQGRWLPMAEIDRKLAEGKGFERGLEEQLRVRRGAAQ
jgi:imidazolonepropionase-like amidohydrolase